MMTEEQKLQWLQSLMAGGVNVNQLNLGDGTQNFYMSGTQRETVRPASETAVEQAIAALYEATFEEGGEQKPLFQDQAQWYAVYRVLVEYCGYPGKMSDFVNLVKERGYSNQSPRCDYDSLKKTSQRCPRLACRPDMWQQFANLSENYHKQCRVAEFLQERLGMG